MYIQGKVDLSLPGSGLCADFTGPLSTEVSRDFLKNCKSISKQHKNFALIFVRFEGCELEKSLVNEVKDSLKDAANGYFYSDEKVKPEGLPMGCNFLVLFVPDEHRMLTLKEDYLEGELGLCVGSRLSRMAFSYMAAEQISNEVVEKLS